MKRIVLLPVSLTSFGLFIFMLKACVTGHLIRTPNGYHISKNETFKLRDQFRLPDTAVLSLTQRMIWLVFTGLMAGRS